MTFLLFLKALDVKTWIIIGMGALIVSMWIAMQFQGARVSTLKSKVAEKDIVIQQYKLDVTNLTDAIKKQNEAVDTLVKRNDEFELVLGATSEENARLSSQAERLIAMVRKNHVPPDCKGATDHLNSFTNDFGKEWNNK